MVGTRAPPPLSMIHGDVKFILNDISFLPAVMQQLSSITVASKDKSLPQSVAELSGASAQLLPLLLTKSCRHPRSPRDPIFGVLVAQQASQAARSIELCS